MTVRKAAMHQTRSITCGYPPCSTVKEVKRKNDGNWPVYCGNDCARAMIKRRMAVGFAESRANPAATKYPNRQN